MRFGRVDRFAREQHFQRAPAADQARQALRAAISGNNSSFTSGWPSLRVSATRTRTVQAIASSSPPPSANPFTAATDGFGMVSSPRKIACPRSDKSARFHRINDRQFVDIGAGDERLFPGAGQDQRADRGSLRDASEMRLPVPTPSRAIQRIQLVAAG